MLILFLILLLCPYNFEINGVCKYRLKEGQTDPGENDYDVYHGLLSGENLYMYELNSIKV